MAREQKEALREWANAYGKTVRQRNVRQDTCAYKAGTLPLYAYEKQCPPTHPIDLTLPEPGPQDEEVHSEYDSDSSIASIESIREESDSSDVETVHSDSDSSEAMDSDLRSSLGQKRSQNTAVLGPLNFMPKNTRTGRQIKISYKYL